MNPEEHQMRRALDMRAMSPEEMAERDLRLAPLMMNDTRTPDGLQNDVWCSNTDHLQHFVEPPKPTLWQRVKARIGL